ncbi:MAG: STAS domain-containing protein [candidate division KSB1 bacterium]|nr:STAS domain-containing protein [candidate division KSB1 bacterium]MDZ7317837.1 STAS domain-containing protein [candidate division KSB1 bacterium]
MDIESRLEQNTGIISFMGATLGEPADSKRFEMQLKELLKQGIKRVVLDLSHVHRINSTGLAILITATTLCTNCGSDKVALVAVNEFIQGALTLTRLNQFFEYYDTLEAAMVE